MLSTTRSITFTVSFTTLTLCQLVGQERMSLRDAELRVVKAKLARRDASLAASAAAKATAKSQVIPDDEVKPQRIQIMKVITLHGMLPGDITTPVMP